MFETINNEMKYLSKLRSDTSIRTKRLWLRQIDETDAESIVRLRSDEEVYKYFTNPVKITVDEHRTWYKKNYCCDPNRIDWIGVDDETGALIGVYGAKREGTTVEVSYLTNAAYKSQGFASEAVKAIIEWCVENWNVDTAVAEIHKDNIGSLSFIHKLGFYEAAKNELFVQMKKRIRQNMDQKVSQLPPLYTEDGRKK